MAWLETCRIDAKNQVNHLKGQGLSVRQAIKKLSEESGIPENTINNWIYERSGPRKMDAFHFMIETIHDEFVQEGTLSREQIETLVSKSDKYLPNWALLWLHLEEEYVLNWYQEAFEKHGKSIRLTDMFRTGKVWCDCPECNGKTYEGSVFDFAWTPTLREVFTPGGYVNFNAIEQFRVRD
jgi:hypothetical protein